MEFCWIQGSRAWIRPGPPRTSLCTFPAGISHSHTLNSFPGVLGAPAEPSPIPIFFPPFFLTHKLKKNRIKGHFKVFQYLFERTGHTRSDIPAQGQGRDRIPSSRKRPWWLLVILSQLFPFSLQILQKKGVRNSLWANSQHLATPKPWENQEFPPS